MRGQRRAAGGLQRGQAQIVRGDHADGAALTERANGQARPELALAGVGAVQDLVEQVAQRRTAGARRPLVLHHRATYARLRLGHADPSRISGDSATT